MCRLYALRSAKDGKRYTGVTFDLRRRPREHNSGGVRSTRGRRTLVLVYTEAFQTRGQALARERYFKTPEGGALKQRLVSGRENSGKRC